jgi:hypothetical protein
MSPKAQFKFKIAIMRQKNFIHLHTYIVHTNNDDDDDDDDDDNNNNNNNAIQFFIIYVPSEQLQGQLQTHHSADTSNYIMDKHNIKSKTN